MTLLLTIFAAVFATVAWYVNQPKNDLNLGVLCFLFWGASVMWFVDAIFEYIELGAEYFTPEITDMVNDTFLGLSVIAMALIIWVVSLLIKDPKGVMTKIFFKVKSKENS